MNKLILFLFLVPAVRVQSQPLTVEKIMQNPQWIGTSPTNIYWGYNSKSLFFKWNPEKNKTDSAYVYTLNSAQPVKIGYRTSQWMEAVADGVYNNNKSKVAFTYEGDVYLLDIATDQTVRITQTDDFETALGFSLKEEWVVYRKEENMYAWSIRTGLTKQLTLFSKEDGPPAAKSLTKQDVWLQNQQLQLFDVLREKKAKRDSRADYLNGIKETDTLHVLYTSGKEVDGLQISPDGRFITWRLYEAADEKETIVPSYVTESGYTKDIPARSKVGRPGGTFEFYVYDRLEDTVMQVMTDNIPGIKDRPDFTRDYPGKYKDSAEARSVFVVGPYWNKDGSAGFVDIRAFDNKDRWLMQLDGATGKLSLVDRQRDEAWIGGPGVDEFEQGWIDNNNLYFQSEVTGYSHLYTYNIQTHSRKALTQGNYEVLQAIPARDGKYFYLLTNEAHPGKKNLYRINSDGSNKVQLSSMTGGYELFISPDEKNIAYRYSYQNKPWELFVQENAPGKKPVQVTDKAVSHAFKSYAWRDAKILSFTASDGQQVYARVYEPANGKKNNAAVIFVHGAGYLQNVAYEWSYYYREMMFNNLLADKGYTVIDIDYRGSAGYGRNWRTGIYRYMGGKDLDDEVDAAGWLVKNYGIDPARIGMYGGSYGGFMALMALFTKPTVFKAGAALRPVTDWAHYNHEYTCNILNEPFSDSIAYQRSSPINFAAGLRNHLLICHGMVDVNVHYQDVVRLAQRLIELGKDNWEVASYPVEDHSFTEPSSWTDEYKRILKLFDDNLVGK